MPDKASGPLLAQLSATLEKDEAQRQALVKKIRGIVVFVIDGAEWTLDLREGQGTLSKGPPPDKADITLTMNGESIPLLACALLLCPATPVDSSKGWCH